jgi:hypothetical protein
VKPCSIALSGERRFALIYGGLVGILGNSRLTLEDVYAALLAMRRLGGNGRPRLTELELRKRQNPLSTKQSIRLATRVTITSCDAAIVSADSQGLSRFIELELAKMTEPVIDDEFIRDSRKKCVLRECVFYKRPSCSGMIAQENRFCLSLAT